MTDLTAITEAACAAFSKLGGDLVDPPMLMPAALFLELSGEVVRSRLCVFTDADGHEVALRPDLTLPVAVSEAARQAEGDGAPRTYRYDARAFRLPAAVGEPMEFNQIGVERFGGPSTPEADIEIFQAVCDAVQATGAPIGKVYMGDLAIFAAFVDALDLPEAMRDGLKRAFRQQGGIAALLDGKQVASPNTAMAAHLATAKLQDAEALVGELLDMSGKAPVGTRTIAEIAERLIEKQARSAVGGVPQAAADILRDVLAISGAPERAVEQITRLAHTHGLSGVDDAVEALSARMTGLSSLGGAADMQFATAFGRRFNYYDGFLFELFAPDASMHAPMGAGGRYDTLVGRLSDGAVAASGIGGVVRPRRLAAAVEASS